MTGALGDRPAALPQNPLSALVNCLSLCPPFLPPFPIFLTHFYHPSFLSASDPPWALNWTSGSPVVNLANGEGAGLACSWVAQLQDAGDSISKLRRAALVSAVLPLEADPVFM